MHLTFFSAAAQVLASSESLPEGNILHLDSQLIVEIAAMAFSVLVLIIVFAWLAYKPVKKFMQGREQRVSGQLESAEAGVQKAQELQAQYEKLIADIDIEREALLEQERAVALERSEEIIADARREAAGIYRRSMEELRMEQENSADEMKHAIVEIATAMAAQFVSVSIDREAHDRYIEEAGNYLEDFTWDT